MNYDLTVKSLVDRQKALAILEKPLNLNEKDSAGRFLHRPVCLPESGQRMELAGKDVTVKYSNFSASGLH